MRHKPARDSDARNRLLFETLEQRELLAADTATDWWPSADVSAIDDSWAWTDDGSWVADPGGDASWDGGFWDGGFSDGEFWDDGLWVDDSAWQTTDGGAPDSGAYDWSTIPVDDVDDTATDTADPWSPVPAPLPGESVVAPVVDEETVVDEVVVPIEAGESPTDESADAYAVSGDIDPVDPVPTELPPVEDLVLDQNAASSGDEAAVEAWSPDESSTGTDDLEPTALPDDEVIPDRVILDETIPQESDPGVAVPGDDTATPPDDAIRTESGVVTTPELVPDGGPKTSPLLAGSGRGELFRAWGAFFLPGFGQSMNAADGLAAGPQSEATTPTGRPRSRLPFRSVR